jgi:hypothetical protein
MTSLQDTPIESKTFATLRERFRGALLQPKEEGYDEARRIWNGAIDRRPALIARCVGTDDVVEAVRFARERDLLISVRGGGHAVAGHAVCDGGLMIDLSLMKYVQVDPQVRTARAAGGLLWSELDGATQQFGLATTGGIISHTGIAGLTLGGGLGHLMRKHGLTVDNLLSVDLVTADARRLRVDAESELDLFWGLRGGGGNFGIATAFEYRLHPVGPLMLGGPIFWPISDAPQVLRFLRDFAPEAPEELGITLTMMLAPRPRSYRQSSSESRWWAWCWSGRAIPWKASGRSRRCAVWAPRSPTRSAWRRTSFSKRCSTGAHRTGGTTIGSRTGSRVSPIR